MSTNTLAAENDGGQRIKVVTTFSVLADMVSAVGGEYVEVTTLVDWGEDAHVYRPSPQDIRRLAQADVLVMNGLGFEGWIARLVAAAGFQGTTVLASQGVDYIDLEGGKHEGHDGHDDHEGEHHDVEHADEKLDPHAWHSLHAAKHYVRNIADALSSIDSAHDAQYRSQLATYLTAIDALFIESKAAFSLLSDAQRHIVVPHNAFAYLARDYGLSVHSLQGLSTESEASAARIAAIVRQIRSLGVKAIFAENVSDNRLMMVVKQETGVHFGGELISGALSRQLAPTYLDMMRYNLDQIVGALQK